MTRQKIKKKTTKTNKLAAVFLSAASCLCQLPGLSQDRSPEAQAHKSLTPQGTGLPETPLVVRGWLLDVGWLHATGEVLWP